MAWPSGTKAGTTNVDAGTDRPSNARADIKQNIDNVNDIIDHLNISSPSDGDILQYSSSTGKWEQVASTSVGSAAGTQVILNADASNLNLDSSLTRQAGTFKIPLTEIYDDGNLITITNDTFVLGTGSYWIEIVSDISHGGDNNFSLYNVTDTVEIIEFSPDTASATNEEMGFFALSGNKTLQFQKTVDANFTTNGEAKIRISKY